MRKMYDGKSNTKGLRNAQKYSNTKECNCPVFSYIKQSSSVQSRQIPLPLCLSVGTFSVPLWKTEVNRVEEPCPRRCTWFFP